ncbi:MAG: phosphate/phosphite/phosphonate ABC transporter substrate-binding protein [Clostridia bacterium]
MKNLLSALLILVLAIVFTGCETQGQDNTDSDEPIEYLLASLPNDGGEITPGTQLIIDEMNRALEQYNATVKYVSADDYSVVAESIITGQAHFGTPSGATFTKAHLEDSDIIPMWVAAPNGNPDEGGYPAFIGTHIDNKSDFEGLSEEEAIESLKGKPFSFVSATSTSGRLVPTTTLYDVFGPEGTGDVSSRNYIFEETTEDGGIFSEVQFGGNHPGSVNLIAEKKVYAGAFCCSYADEREDDIYIISEKRVPPGPYWTNTKYVDQEHIDALVDHFTNLDESNALPGLFGNGEDDIYTPDYQFVAVDHTFYNFLKEMYAGE